MPNGQPMPQNPQNVFRYNYSGMQGMFPYAQNNPGLSQNLVQRMQYGYSPPPWAGGGIPQGPWGSPGSSYSSGANQQQQQTTYENNLAQEYRRLTEARAADLRNSGNQTFQPQPRRYYGEIDASSPLGGSTPQQVPAAPTASQPSGSTIGATPPATPTTVPTPPPLRPPYYGGVNDVMNGNMTVADLIRMYTNQHPGAPNQTDISNVMNGQGNITDLIKQTGQVTGVPSNPTQGTPSSPGVTPPPGAPTPAGVQAQIPGVLNSNDPNGPNITDLIRQISQYQPGMGLGIARPPQLQPPPMQPNFGMGQYGSYGGYGFNPYGSGYNPYQQMTQNFGPSNPYAQYGNPYMSGGGYGGGWNPWMR